MTSVERVDSPVEQTKKEVLDNIYVYIISDGQGSIGEISSAFKQDKKSIDTLFLILKDFMLCYNSQYLSLFEEDCIFNVLKLYYEYVKQDKDQKIQKELIESLAQIHQDKINELHIRTLHSFEVNISNIKSDLDKYKQEAREISSELRNKWKLSSFAGSFQEIATKEEGVKIIWMIAAFAFSAVATCFVLCSSVRMLANEFNIPLVEFLQKLANTIFLYAMAFWCSKRYYICRSQEISYRHIAAILNVYDMFKNTSDADEKHIIITEMAHTIFSPPVLPNMKTIENSDWQKILDIIKITTTKEIKG